MKNRALLFKIFFTSFLDFVAFGILIPVLPFLFSNDTTSIFKDFYTKEQLTLLYGWLIGIYSVGAVVGAPLLGALSDKFGRKKILIFANSISLINYLLLALGTYWVSIFLIFFARILGGGIGATLNTVQAALADASDEKSKAANFGLTGVAFGLGFLTGVLLISGIAQFSWFDYTYAFIISATINCINIIYLATIFPETLPEATKKKIYLWTGLANIKKALINPTYRFIFLIIFTLSVGLAFFSQFVQFYFMDKFSVDVTAVGIFFGYSGLLIALVQGVLLRPISQRFTAKQILQFSIPCFALSYLLILMPTQFWQVYFIMPIMVFFQGLIFPTVLAIASNLANKNVQGEIIGINQSMQSLANALPAISLGYLVGFNVSFPMWFGFGCTAIASVLLGWYYSQSVTK